VVLGRQAVLAQRVEVYGHVMLARLCGSLVWMAVRNTVRFREVDFRVHGRYPCSDVVRAFRTQR